MIYVVFLLGILLAYVADKRKSEFFVFCLVVLLSLFVGTRTKTVGIDTEVYYEVMNNLRQGIFSPNIEKGFLLLCWLLLKVFNIEQVVLLIAFVSVALIIKRLWTMRRQHSFPLMVALFLVSYYSEMANIMRQYLAIALVFYGTYYLDRKKYFSFLLFLAVATAMHSSAILAALYVPIYALISDTEKVKKNKSALFYLVLLPIVVGVGGSIVIKKYGYYIADSNNTFGLLHPMKLVLAIAFCMINAGVFQWYRNKKGYLSVNHGQYYLTISREPNIRNFGVVALSYMLGIALTTLGYINTSLYRVGLIFQPFEYPFVASVFRYKPNGVFFKTIYILLFLFIIYSNLSSSWSGLADYSSWLFSFI